MTARAEKRLARFTRAQAKIKSVPRSLDCITGLCEDLANESDKRKCWTRDLGT